MLFDWGWQLNDLLFIITMRFPINRKIIYFLVCLFMSNIVLIKAAN